MIDIHCHVIPNIDDGADSVDTSIKMLKMAEADGVSTIIATPHFRPGVYDNEFEAVVKKVMELNQIAKEENIKIEILPGQEVFLDKNILKNIKAGNIKGINNSKYLLVELPMDRCPDYAMDMIYELKLLGMSTIIAHPERYEYIIDDLSFINNFIDEGCLFQSNTTSVLGGFGKSVKKTAYELLKYGVIDFVSSDAHGIRGRVPLLKECYEIIGEIDRVLPNQITNNLDKLIKAEEAFSEHDRIKVKKSILSRIK